jgi:hypothetical protein
LFSFKTDFFFAKTRDGLEGVQRRGPVKGAGKFRVHRRPLTGSTAGVTPVFKGAGLSGEKMKREKTSAENTYSVVLSNVALPLLARNVGFTKRLG